jgi:NitT/TauT family transport system permease protein
MKALHGIIWRTLPPLLVFAAAIFVWDATVRIFAVPAYLLPRPRAVIVSLFLNRAELFPSLKTTAQAALAGFTASAVIGVLIAVPLSSSSFLRRAFYPYTIFFQTVPIVAIAPMLIIWVGYGFRSVVLSSFIVSVFPVIANTLIGLLSTDPALIDLFRLYGARRVASLWKLRLPAALPSILTGLRIAAGLSVIGTVVADVLVGESVGDRVGLGMLIMSASKESKTALAFAAVILASLLGLALFGAVNLAGHLALRRWHASEQ